MQKEELPAQTVPTITRDSQVYHQSTENIQINIPKTWRFHKTLAFFTDIWLNNQQITNTRVTWLFSQIFKAYFIYFDILI